MHKVCNRCGELKLIKEFSRSKDKIDGIYPTCKQCVKIRRTEIVEERLAGTHASGDGSKICEWCEVSIGGRRNKKFCKESCAQKARRVRSYGITVAEYKNLLAEQNGVCRLCQRETTNWNIDHNHNTLETYGIICGTCNSQLVAWTFHDIEIAKRLLDYLENPPIRQRLGIRQVTQRVVSRQRIEKDGPWIWRKNASKD